MEKEIQNTPMPECIEDSVATTDMTPESSQTDDFVPQEEVETLPMLFGPPTLPVEEPEQEAETGGDNGGDTALPPEWELLLAEAEHRGYVRGRNESIEKLMAPQPAPDPAAASEREVLILNNLRPSVWDV